VAVGHEPLTDVRADEAGNAGDKDAHGRQAYRMTWMSFQSSAILRPPVGVCRQVRSSGGRSLEEASRHGIARRVRTPRPEAVESRQS
jgi:hypothetical protein